MAKFDTGGALSGAASGAGIGSAFGPVGTGVGAVAGGLLGAFGRKKKKAKRISTLDKTQQGIYNQYAKGIQGEGPFADLYNFNPEQARDVFSQMYAQPAYQQFQEEVIPGITGQFRGGNLQNSSYLGGALAKAGTDVQRNLNANLSNMLYQGQQDALQRRINAINNILNMQTFAYQKPQESQGDSFWNSLLSKGGEAFGNLASGWMSNGSNTNSSGNSAVSSSNGRSVVSSSRASLPNFSFKPGGY